MEEHGLTEESVLFRETRAEFLVETEDPDVLLISANHDPSEAVVDEYGGGYVTPAAQLGPGLAFTTERENQWREDGRVTVAVRVKDVLDQDGRVYPVESVITERVLYFTLPAGRIRVKKV